MKLIPYDYLYGKRDVFPLSYKLVFLKLLDEAPNAPDTYDDGYREGYENGIMEGYENGYNDGFNDGSDEDQTGEVFND